jgi:hypothetical protein
LPACKQPRRHRPIAVDGHVGISQRTAARPLHAKGPPPRHQTVNSRILRQNTPEHQPIRQVLLDNPAPRLLRLAVAAHNLHENTLGPHGQPAPDHAQDAATANALPFRPLRHGHEHLNQIDRPGSQRHATLVCRIADLLGRLAHKFLGLRPHNGGIVQGL